MINIDRNRCWPAWPSEMRLPNLDQSEFAGRVFAAPLTLVQRYARHGRVTVSDHQQISDFYPLRKPLFLSQELGAASPLLFSWSISFVFRHFRSALRESLARFVARVPRFLFDRFIHVFIRIVPSQLSRAREALATNLPNRLRFFAFCFVVMR
jgi:hypothetical protein